MTEEELSLLQEAAKEQSDAQYKLGMMYVYGETVPEDYEKAIGLLTMASKQGHVEAAYNLGICYHYGFGTKVDLEKAFDLYMSSARNGYAKGKHLIGRFYYYGWHVRQDYAEAIKWFEESDKLKDPTSCGFNSCYLGVCYERGFGVKPDAKKAKELFDRAISEGGEDARALIDKLLN